MTYEIRMASPGDVTDLQRVLRRLDSLHSDAMPGVFSAPEQQAATMAFITSFLKDPNATILVADSRGEVIGACSIRMQTIEKLGLLPRRQGYVNRLVVAPGWQGLGVGKALMRAAHLWASSRGASEVELTVWEFNQSAIGFYESLGYSTDSRRMRVSLESHGRREAETGAHRG